MYRRSKSNLKMHWDFIVLDMLCLVVSLLSAYWISFGFTMEIDLVYANIFFFLLLFDFFVIVCTGAFQDVLSRGYWKEFLATFRQAVLIELVFVAYLFITHSEQYLRLVIFLCGFYYLVLCYVVKIAWKAFVKKRRTLEQASLIIITSFSSAEHVAEMIRSNIYENYRVMGIIIIDKDMAGQEIGGVKVLTDSKTTLDYVCRNWVDEVLFDVPSDMDLPEGMVRGLSEMGVVVHLKIDEQSTDDGCKRFVERFGHYAVLTMSINYASDVQLLIKRLMDIVGGLAGCLATAVLFLFLAPAIYIQSPGPIFFTQIRVGKNGKKFKMYKFRSMNVNAEQEKKELEEQNRVKDGMMFKLEYDPRIIGSKRLPDGTVKKGLGNIIRDYSLDEFPQFLNVLKGDMSLVGTRPPTVDEWEKYELHHRSRLAAKPGITGMWQVSGRSEITDFEEVVKLDLQYIREWNLGLDIKILLKTIAVVFKKRGSM